MTLPRLLLLTDRRQLPPGRGLCDQIEYAVRAGVRAVVLRERDLSPDRRTLLAGEIAAVLAPVGGVLIAASPGLPSADGVHLRSTDGLPRTRPQVLGRSCHSRDDIDRAGDEHVDYVVVGPVALTASKPGYGPALGRAGLRRMLRGHAGPPVYALGGVTADNASTWLDAGADGLAVMGELMRAEDPFALAARLLAHVGSR